MQFQCVHCRSDLEGDEQWIGHEVNCPSCDQPVVIPAIPANAPPAAKIASKPKPVATTSYKAAPKGGGFGKFLLVVLLLAAATLGFACYHFHETPQQVWQRIVDDGEKPPQPPVATPIAKSPPVPIATPVPTPMPMLAPPAITNAVAAPTPPPPPDPLAWFLEQNEKSPQDVMLLVDTKFPVIYNGRVSGSGNVPAGNVVKLVQVDSKTKDVTVACPAYGNSTAMVPIESTDLLDRAKTAMAQAEATARKLVAAAAASPVPAEKEKPAEAPSTPANTSSVAANGSKTGTNSSAETSSLKAQDNIALPKRQQVTTHNRTALLTDFKPVITETRNAQSGFIHPGIGLTKAQMDNIQKHVRAGDQPWSDAFEVFTQDNRTRPKPRIYYNGWTDIPGGRPGNFVDFRMRMDADIAFKQIIMWYITGNEDYRLNAIHIIRSYSAIKTANRHWDEQIEWGTIAYKLSFAAEILRSSAGKTGESKWTDHDQSEFVELLTLGKQFYNRFWHWMNQHSIGNQGTLGAAIFLDDPDLYAQGVERIMVNSKGEAGGRNGSIKYQIREVTKNATTGEDVHPNIQLVEMGRDVGHAWGNIGALSTCVQTIYNQGTLVDPETGAISKESNAVDVFSFLNDRLLAGANYVTKYELGLDVTYVPCFAQGTTQIFSAINPDRRGRIDPLLGILYNHYKYIKKWNMNDDRIKYVTQAYENYMPEGASQDSLGSGTLLFTSDETPNPFGSER